MILDNAAADIQAQAGTLSNGFRGEERFKNTSSNVWRNTRPVIDNLHNDVCRIAGSTNLKLAFALYGIDCIADEICPHLVQFAAVNVDLRKLTVVLTNHSDSLFQTMAQHDKCVFNARVNIDLLLGGLIHIGVLFDSPHEFRNPADAAFDLVE